MIATASSSTDLGRPTISVWRRETDSQGAASSMLWSVLLFTIQISIIVVVALAMKKAADSVNSDMGQDIVRIIVNAVRRYGGGDLAHAQAEIERFNGSASPVLY
jgi:hypothetical protein